MLSELMTILSVTNTPPSFLQWIHFSLIHFYINLTTFSFIWIYAACYIISNSAESLNDALIWDLRDICQEFGWIFIRSSTQLVGINLGYMYVYIESIGQIVTVVEFF